MNIDDAIRHCYEIADRNDVEAKRLRLLGKAPDELGRTASSCKECANNHRQLAEWLTELKELREKQKWIPCSERLPDEPNIYTVTDSKGDVVRFVFYDTESSRKYWLRCAKAWMPLPSPYQPEDGFTKWAKSVADEHRKKGEIE